MSVTQHLDGDLPKPRILMVDDERHNIDVLRGMLSSEGYDLLSAASAEEAMAIVLKHPPDLMLLDVLMPGMDGFELTTLVKSDVSTKSIPVILVTALDDRKGRLLGLIAGAEDFLSKPIDRAELCARVRNLLRLKASIEEARAARAMAEEANRAKTLFLHAMSHELRTPLSAIIGYTELLQLGLRGPMSVDQTSDVGRIGRAAAYLHRLINDLLAMAKLERPRPLKLESIAATSVLAEVESLCALKAKAKAQRLTITPSSREVIVTADAERFQQILINLVMNAIKFTPRGGTVTVATETENGTARFRVADTGIGIGASDQERVFEPFVQIERDRTAAEEQGVGLGLAISRELARAMHGDLTLQSTEGAGSTFLLTLPIA